MSSIVYSLVLVERGFSCSLSHSASWKLYVPVADKIGHIDNTLWCVLQVGRPYKCASLELLGQREFGRFLQTTASFLFFEVDGNGGNTLVVFLYWRVTLC